MRFRGSRILVLWFGSAGSTWTHHVKRTKNRFLCVVEEYVCSSDLLSRSDKRTRFDDIEDERISKTVFLRLRTCIQTKTSPCYCFFFIMLVNIVVGLRCAGFFECQQSTCDPFPIKRRTLLNQELYFVCTKIVVRLCMLSEFATRHSVGSHTQSI